MTVETILWWTCAVGAACVTGGGPSFYRGQSRQFELCWFVTHSVGVQVNRPEFQVRYFDKSS